MQEAVANFIDRHHLSCGEKIRYMDLVSEVGELGKEIIKGGDYGKCTYKTTAQAKDEMGDCLFSLLALCCEMNIDAGAALESSLKKYEKRFAAKGEIGSGN